MTRASGGTVIIPAFEGPLYNNACMHAQCLVVYRGEGRGCFWLSDTNATCRSVTQKSSSQDPAPRTSSKLFVLPRRFLCTPSDMLYRSLVVVLASLNVAAGLMVTPAGAQRTVVTIPRAPVSVMVSATHRLFSLGRMHVCQGVQLTHDLGRRRWTPRRSKSFVI